MDRQTLLGIPSVRTGQCAVLLGVSRCVIIRLANEGRLPHWRSPGGQRRFPRALIEQVALELEGQETLPMEVAR